MNNLQIKLAISIGLINLPPDNVLKGIIESIAPFKNQLGDFLSLDLEKESPLNRSQVYRQFALYYEHAVLQVGIVTNPFSKAQTLEHFQIKAPVRFAA
ncbi:MAG: hypothetical protein ACOYOO_15175 [Saprospiraceae bacterium]|jgi:hypothetical protein